MLTPTQSEFDNLPATVQRKCFSTLERLRYAEAQAQAQTRTAAPLTSHFNPKRLLSNGQTSLNKIKNTVQPLLQRSTPPRQHSGNLTRATVTPEDALWFSRLPEKIQRGQFSIEEQKLLTPRKEDVILDAADEKFYQLGEKLGNRSLPSLASSYTGPSTVESIDLDEGDDNDDYSSVFSADYAMESEDLLDSFRWLDTDLDLSLDDYHVHVAETANKKMMKTSEKYAVLRKQRSMVGTPSLKTALSSSFASRKSIEEWGSTWAPTVAPSMIGRAVSTNTASNTNHPPPLRREHTSIPLTAEKEGSGWAPSIQAKAKSTQGDARTPILNAGATHYLNPEARLKLKHYLASPSKFDEALEFGFPSLNSTSSIRPSTATRRPSTAGAQSVRRHKPPKDFSGSPTFLDDTTTTTASVAQTNLEARLDLTSELSRFSTPVPRDQVDQVSSLETPINPSIDSFQPSSLTTSQAQDQSELHAQVKQMDREPYLRAWPDREMTLRMTLTRPDLRADESLLYPSQPLPEPVPRFNVLKRSISVKGLRGNGGYADNDLLKLEELQLGDDAATIGLGKERPSGLRRFLSRK